MFSKIALTIGGSDSGGGAGIQADLKTFTALGVHGCTAITCITAQNSLVVKSVEAIEINNLTDQIQTLFADIKINALKTGMLLNESIIKTTANNIKDFKIPKIIDPVMVSRTGSKLLENDAIKAYKKYLFPQADIVTPNIYEANLLTGINIKDKTDIEKAGKIIINLGVNSVLIKGGGLPHLRGFDFFIDKNGFRDWLKHKPINTKNTHGSGCTLSAAICGYRASGIDTIKSIKKAKIFIETSLINSYQIGSDPGPLRHY